jgi:hypothetical protein
VRSSLRAVPFGREPAPAPPLITEDQEKAELVTRNFLRAEVNVLKAEIQAMLNRQLQIMMALMIAMTGIFATIVKL